MTRLAREQRGFSLLELMAAMGIFLIICAAMFGLLQVSQQKYSSESQMSGAFQEARLGIDQIVRDINISGYPSQNMFSKPASTASYAVGPLAWDPGYPTIPSCQVGACATPSDYDAIVETDLGDGNVSWIRYTLTGTTLFRGVVQKTAGADPVAATAAAGVMVPLVSNVVNNPAALPADAQAQLIAQYPGIFPGGAPRPLFQYSCATPAGSQPCTLAPTAYNAARLVSDVDVTLIVMTQTPDMQTQQLHVMELSGRGHRSNPQN
jgi:prepilin-type N-terminal cleavage/methylation domain-containing protein